MIVGSGSAAYCAAIEAAEAGASVLVLEKSGGVLLTKRVPQMVSKAQGAWDEDRPTPSIPSRTV